MGDSCPTWFTNAIDSCKCGNELNGYVRCHQDILRVDVVVGSCMTLINNNSVVAGSCQNAFMSNITSRVYSSVSDDPAQLDSQFCAPYNRRGLLCGECIDGYGPSPFYSDFCANCSDLNLGAAIGLYLFLVLIPTTIFFCIVLFFHLNIMTGPLLGYIIFCQAHVITLSDNFFLIQSIGSYLPSPLLFIFRSSLFISSLWTLKFFQFNAPLFCISSKMTGIHIHMLSFITTLYLQFLFVITYHIMDCNVQFFTHLPRPGKIIFTYFTKINNKIAANHSVIRIFATFIFLSMAGIIYETFTLIDAIDVYHVNGSVALTVLNNDPTIIKHSGIHLLCMTSGLVLLFLLVLCPSLLLCIYPTRIYEKLSRHVSPRKRLVVKIFAETCHCSFKDGLDGTIDYRMIPSAIILTSIPLAIVLPMVSNSFFSMGVRFFPTTIACLCVTLSLIISYIRPCKSLIMNMSLSFHATLMGLMAILLCLWEQNFLVNTEAVAIGLAILPFVPHILIIMWVAYKIISHILSRYPCNPHNFKRISFMLRRFRRKGHKYEKIDAAGSNNCQQLQIP